MENKDKLDLKRLNPLRRNGFKFKNKTGRRKNLVFAMVREILKFRIYPIREDTPL